MATSTIRKPVASDMGITLGDVVFNGSVTVAEGGTFAVSKQLVYGKKYFVRFEYRGAIGATVGGSGGSGTSAINLTAVRASGTKRYIYNICIENYDSSMNLKVTTSERIVIENGKAPVIEKFNVSITGIWELF